MQPPNVRKIVRSILALISVNSGVIDGILNRTPNMLRRTYNRHNYLPQIRETLGIWEHEIQKIIQCKRLSCWENISFSFLGDIFFVVYFIVNTAYIHPTC